MSHSPLPWKKAIHQPHRKTAQNRLSVDAMDGRIRVLDIEPINSGHSAEAEANVDLIVTAVNNHAKLVNTIEAILNDCDDFGSDELDLTAVEMIDAIRNACFVALQSLSLDTTPNQDVAQP